MMFLHLLRYSLTITFLVIGLSPIHSQSCNSDPNNPYISNTFTWEGSGYGNEAVMHRTETNATSTVNGCSENLIVTMNLENPDNVFFSNLQDGDASGTNGTFTQTMPGYSMWLDNNNILFDDNEMDLDEEASLVLNFSSPIILRGVTIKDIDWRNFGVTARWRDKVTLTAQDRFGANVPLTATLEDPVNSTIAINGQTALADYNFTEGEGGLDVMDNQGHVTWNSTSEISVLKITYISGVGQAGQQIIQISNIDFCCRNTTTAQNDINQTPINVNHYGRILTNDYDREGHNQTIQSASYLNSSGIITPLSLGTSTSIYDKSNILAGSIILNSNGAYTFVPAINYVGSVPLEYVVIDDNINPATDNATLDIDVIPLNNSTSNQAPLANDDTNTTKEDVTIRANVIIPNDSDPDNADPKNNGGDDDDDDDDDDSNDDIITVVSALIDKDGNGILDNSLTLGVNRNIYGFNTDGISALAGKIKLKSNGDYIFNPNPDFIGRVLLEYTIEDLSSASDKALLTIDVEPGITNRTYTNDDAAIAGQDVNLNGDILDNDHDPESNDQDVVMIDTNGDGIPDTNPTADIPEIISRNGATLGELTINPETGVYFWDPEPTFIGTANIVYTATDGTDLDKATLYLSHLPNMYKDYSDAPSIYPMVFHSDIVDVDNDETPDSRNSVWLGSKSSYETTGWLSENAEGDTADDAIKFGTSPGDFPISVAPNNQYDIDVSINSSELTTVYFGMWIDYNNDGNYDDFYNGSEVTSNLTRSSVTITTPSNLLDFGSPIINVRIRADDSPLIASDFVGNKLNGEVEDYQAIIVLPVELTQFTAQSNRCDVELFWETATELNNDYFMVEHSFDGVEFEPIGFVEGNGTSNTTQEYHFIHEDVRQNLNYYRLKQVDYDNSFDYSEVVNIITDCYDSVQGVTKIYPNPTMTEIKLEFYMESARNVELIITDITGREIDRNSIELNEGNNIFGMDLSNYQSGTYFIQMKNNKGWNSQTFKVIKIE